MANGDSNEGKAISGIDEVSFRVSNPSLYPVLALLLGFMLYKVWEEVMFVGSSLDFPGVDFSRHQLFFAARGVAMLACALLYRKIGRISSRPSALAALFVLLVASTLAMVSARYYADGATALILFGSVAGGIGIGILNLLLFESCETLGAVVFFVCYLLVSLCAPLVMTACYHLSDPLLIALAFLLAIGSPLAILFGMRSLASREKQAPFDRMQSPPWKAIALLATFGFVFAFEEPLLNNTEFASGSYTAVGSIAARIVMLSCVVLYGKRFNPWFVFQTVLPLTIVSFLMLPSELDITREISSISASASYSFVDALAILSLASFCNRYKAPSIREFGFAYGLHYVLIAVGEGAWIALYASGFSGDESGMAVVIALVSTAAIMATFLLIPTKRDFRSWGVAVVPRPSSSGGDSPEIEKEKQLEDSCRAVAKSYRLTPREEEVLACIAQDLTTAEIQEKLCIAKETVRTHRRNILMKCEVASQDELQALVEQELASQTQRYRVSSGER